MIGWRICALVWAKANERRKPAGGGHRIRYERILFHDFIDPAARQSLVGFVSRAARQDGATARRRIKRPLVR